MNEATRNMYRKAYGAVEDGTYVIDGRKFVVKVDRFGRAIREVKGRSRRLVDNPTWTRVMNHLSGLEVWA